MHDALPAGYLLFTQSRWDDGDGSRLHQDSRQLSERRCHLRLHETVLLHDAGCDVHGVVRRVRVADLFLAQRLVDFFGADFAAHGVGIDAVEASGVQTQDFFLHRGREIRIAVHRGNAERAHRDDLFLG